MPGGDSLTPFLTLCAARVFGKLSRLFLPCLSDGVMVTQRPLEALFMVRIHVGQPNYSMSLISTVYLTQF